MLAIRGAIGGVLMGLANLVPGISGGTMLLAAGVYPRFIEAIGEVTTFKFKRTSLTVLGSVVIAALIAILLFAGTVKSLVVDHRWAMYSLFIGLTLGGVPVVLRLIRQSAQSDLSPQSQATASEQNLHAAWIGAAFGFIAMTSLALAQSTGMTGDAQRDGFTFLLLAGIAGAAAMILPGVSGGYLLLVLGVYIPILTGIDTFKEAIKASDWDTLVTIGGRVVLPLGLGVLIGIIGVSNLLRWLLRRHEKATLGFLLGLLVGAVVGLWPFQQSIAPKPGQLIKGQEVVASASLGETNETKWYYVQTGEKVDAEDLPTGFFSPSTGQIAAALGLIACGFAGTRLIDRMQGKASA